MRYELLDQWFTQGIAEHVERLMPHAEFLRDLRTSGGSSQLIVAFLGDGYLADAVPFATMAKIVELQLDFGIESYVVPQNQTPLQDVIPVPNPPSN